MTLMQMRERLYSRQKGATTLEYIVLAAVLVLGLVTAINYFKTQAAEGIKHEGNVLKEVANGNFSNTASYGSDKTGVQGGPAE